MVDVLGHVAMGFLWSLPARYRWDGRVSVAFIGFVLSTSMLPDVEPLKRRGSNRTMTGAPPSSRVASDPVAPSRPWPPLGGGPSRG